MKIKTFDINIRYDKENDLNEVNCIGYFNDSFFSLVDIIRRQEKVYEYLKKEKKNAKGINTAKMIYEVLEHMRVKLMNISKPIVW